LGAATTLASQGKDLGAIGWDKSVETWLLDRTPDWLTAATTRF
jgi:hypothetical protein